MWFEYPTAKQGPAPMHVKLFTLRFQNIVGAFDDTSMLEFCRGRDLIGFREHFFLVHEIPHVLCVVTWQDGAPAFIPGAADTPRKIDPSATARAAAPHSFSDADRALFDKMRGWRSRRAKAEGLPPYIVLTNRELAEIVRLKPTSVNALGQISGIGSGKVARFGTDILHELGRVAATPETPATTEIPAAETPMSRAFLLTARRRRPRLRSS